MEGLVTYSLTNIPAYLAYVGSLAGLMLVFVVVYLWITPYREIAMIREGNRAAAISFAGVLVGFALPLASVATSAGSVVDIILWGLIALIGQLVVFLLAMRLMGDLRAGLEANKDSYGILLGGLSIAMGILNAASLSY
jgi:putative membrane protein